jgi:hypothetical protein
LWWHLSILPSTEVKTKTKTKTNKKQTRNKMKLDKIDEKHDDKGEVAVLEQEETSLSTNHHFDDLVGEILQTDIKLPRVNLVQKTSALNGEFKAGDLVFEKQVLLAHEGETFNFTPIMVQKQYQEDLEFGTEDMPRVYNSAAEVRENGGSLTYGDDNYFKEIAHVQLLIEAPAKKLKEHEADMFLIEFKGKHYAMAMMTVAGSAFNSLGKALMTARVNNLKAGFFTGMFTMRADAKSNKRGSWHVPVPSFQGLHDAETQAFIQGL